MGFQIGFSALYLYMQFVTMRGKIDRNFVSIKIVYFILKYVQIR